MANKASNSQASTGQTSTGQASANGVNKKRDSSDKESSGQKSIDPLSKRTNNSGEAAGHDQPQSLGVRSKTNEPRTINSPAGEPYNEDVRH